MSDQVLITGGAGFVGSHLADALLRSGYKVRVLDSLTQQVHEGRMPDYLSPDLELVVGDVRDPAAVGRALADVDLVFHFAAAVGVGQSMYEISRYIGTNTQGTAELLQGILDSKHAPRKLIVASSMSVYGEGQYVCRKCNRELAPKVRSLDQLRKGIWEIQCPDCREVVDPVPTKEDKVSEVNSVYALSKRDQEEMCLIFGRAYEIPVTALRFFNIYGIRQALSNPYTGVAAIFASRMINGQPPLIFEDGQQMRDFVSIHDIVRANMLAIDRPASDWEVINVGCGKPITVTEIAKLLAKALGRETRSIVTRKYRVGDIRHCYADLTKARNLLGYQPQVSHEEGFRQLAEWLAGQQAEDRAETMLNELTAYGLAV
jgi:dTDP-L-rhamnose 4-epimerase